MLKFLGTFNLGKHFCEFRQKLTFVKNASLSGLDFFNLSPEKIVVSELRLINLEVTAAEASLTYFSYQDF